MDLLIASISLTHKFILVTNKQKEFSRISKLKFENWLYPSNVYGITNADNASQQKNK